MWERHLFSAPPTHIIGASWGLSWRPSIWCPRKLTLWSKVLKLKVAGVISLFLDRLNGYIFWRYLLSTPVKLNFCLQKRQLFDSIYVSLNQKCLWHKSVSYKTVIELVALFVALIASSADQLSAEDVLISNRWCFLLDEEVQWLVFKPYNYIYIRPMSYIKRDEK